MDNLQCIDNLAVADPRGKTCDDYKDYPNACGMYDSKGPKCQEMGSYPNCDGDFEASEACCACKSEEQLDKQTFCCNFGVTPSGQVVCELYLGSKIVDQLSPPEFDPSVAVTFEL